MISAVLEFELETVFMVRKEDHHWHSTSVTKAITIREANIILAAYGQPQVWWHMDWGMIKAYLGERRTILLSNEERGVVHVIHNLLITRLS